MQTTDRLDHFLDNAPTTVAILNRHLRLVKVNRAMARAFQMASDDYEGKTLIAVFPDLAPSIQPLLEQILFSGETVSVEITTDLPTHPEVMRHWMILCFPAGEYEVAVVGVELTEQKRREQSVQRLTGQLESTLAQMEKNVMVNEMAHILQAASVTEEIYHAVAGYAPRLLPRHSGSLSTINPSKNIVEVVAAWGGTSGGESVFSPDDCWALREGRLHVVNNVSAGLTCRHANRAFSAHLCVPMVAQYETLGLLHLHSEAGHSTADAFTETEIRLANTVAQEIALPLANVRLREILREQALRDPLTGLYNRRFLQEALEREVCRSVRRRVPIGLILLDIDHFKRLNDTCGHHAGDALLRAIATLLQSRIRGGDVLCRYGGDEFSIILPDASLENTINRAEELRQAVKLLKLESGGNTIERVTISLGAAAYPDHGETLEALLRHADVGLYEAKAAGRDEVRMSAGSKGAGDGIGV